MEDSNDVIIGIWYVCNNGGEWMIWWCVEEDDGPSPTSQYIQTPRQGLLCIIIRIELEGLEEWRAEWNDMYNLCCLWIEQGQISHARLRAKRQAAMAQATTCLPPPFKWKCISFTWLRIIKVTTRIPPVWEIITKLDRVEIRNKNR